MTVAVGVGSEVCCVGETWESFGSTVIFDMSREVVVVVRWGRTN